MAGPRAGTLGWIYGSVSGLCSITDRRSVLAEGSGSLSGRFPFCGLRMARNDSVWVFWIIIMGWRFERCD
jgi:hypothetical protein